MTGGRHRGLASQQIDEIISSSVHNMRAAVTPLKKGIETLRRQLKGQITDHASAQERSDALADYVSFLERIIVSVRS